MVSSHFTSTNLSVNIRTIFIAGLLAVLFIIAAVFFSMKLASSNEKLIQADSSLGFSLSYPATWRQSEQDNLFSLVDTKSTYKNFRSYIRFGLAADVTKDNFNNMYSLPDNSDVSSFFGSSPASKQSISKLKNRSFGSFPAFEVYEESIMPGPFYSDGFYILKEEKVYYLHLTSDSREGLDAEKAVFDQIVSGFKFN